MGRLWTIVVGSHARAVEARGRRCWWGAHIRMDCGARELTRLMQPVTSCPPLLPFSHTGQTGKVVDSPGLWITIVSFLTGIINAVLVL
jgi:hypothetical protein